MGASRGIPFGGYLLRRKLGEGGMAEVFLADEQGQGLRRRVVLKRILPSLADRPEFVTMFLHEARVAARCSHPNVIHLYNFGSVDGSYFIAREYVDGPSAAQLGRLARSAGGIPIKHVLRIVSDMCAGLHHAHLLTDEEGAPLGLIHRDVSLQNILISSNGVAKLVDFGVARSTEQEHHTRAGTLKGKLAYMPPEQYEGTDLDARVDVFALGCVMYALFRGRSPFRRDNDAATMRAVLTEPAPSLVPFGLPEPVDRIVAKATAKDREARYATALEMQQDIEAVAGELGIMANSFQLAAYVRELITAWKAQQQDEDAPPPPKPKDATLVLAEGAFDEVEVEELVASESRSMPSLLAGLPSGLTPSGAAVPERAGSLPALAPAASVSRHGRRAIALVALAALAAAAFAIVYVIPSSTPPEPPTAVAAPAQVEVAPHVTEDEPPAHVDPPRPAEPVVPEPPSAVSLVAYLTIGSEPEGATIELDGQPLGTAPTPTLEVGPGTHTVSATLEGHQDVRESITLSVGQRVERTLQLQPARRDRPAPTGRGRLWVDTQPWSKVSLGGRSLGFTPVTDVEVPAGRHQLVLEEQGGDRHRQVVTVRNGAPTKVFVNLRTGDARVQ